jgi:hydroxymethylglutaryl-CoA lyase
MPENITLVETPRDAFQGLSRLIPTGEKIRYCASLLDAGVKHVDLGSFVSSKAVPQMADSANVFAAFADRAGIERLAIVVNENGAKRAFAAPGVDALGFPFSLSDRFQKENSGKLQFETWPAMKSILHDAQLLKKSFVLYLSMAFGTRYDDPDEKNWSEEKLLAFIETLITVGGVDHISLADTVGVATPSRVKRVFHAVRKTFPGTLFSAHFHGNPRSWMRVVEAALDAGCRRFDCAAGGLGGCPFAHDTLIANIASEKLAARLKKDGFATGVDVERLQHCAKTAREFQARYA